MFSNTNGNDSSRAKRTKVSLVIDLDYAKASMPGLSFLHRLKVTIKKINNSPEGPYLNFCNVIKRKTPLKWTFLSTDTVGRETAGLFYLS